MACSMGRKYRFRGLGIFFFLQSNSSALSNAFLTLISSAREEKGTEAKERPEQTRRIRVVIRIQEISIPYFYIA